VLHKPFALRLPRPLRRLRVLRVLRGCVRRWSPARFSG